MNIFKFNNKYVDMADVALCVGPDWNDCYVLEATYTDGTDLTEDELIDIEMHPEVDEALRELHEIESQQSEESETWQ